MSEPTNKQAASEIRIERGTCWVMLAYDIGMGINLDAAHAALTPGASREELAHHRRGARYLQFSPPPLRIDQDGQPTSIDTDSFAGAGSARFETESRVECTLFDFGAVSVAYRIPISGPLQGLLPLGHGLYENKALLVDSRRRVEHLVDKLGSAVYRASIASVVEDYVVYHVKEWSGAAPIGEALAGHASTVAALLRAEPGALSEQELADAIACRISFSPGDAAVIDWNAALVCDPLAEDVLAVLEFANVELLELRYLDDRLDGILDRAYKTLHARSGLRRWLIGRGREERRQIAAMQMDAALLFEGINNALKLVGDQYLARLYRLTAQRLHLQDWDASIMRKLQTIDGIYQKMTDAAASRRMELLEWIVIILIAAEIVISFARGVGR